MEKSQRDHIVDKEDYVVPQLEVVTLRGREVLAETCEYHPPEDPGFSCGP